MMWKILKMEIPCLMLNQVLLNLSSWYSSLLQQASVYGIAAGYCLSASLLSIINKWAVMKFPYPGALTALQYFTSVLGVVVCGWLKLVEHDKLDLLTMWRFLPAAIIFYLSLFTNSELLLHANVDTFIVFRSAVPIFVAIGETLYLHQPWPALRAWFSLGTIFAGSVLYVITDYQFTLTAYSWALAYLVSMSIDFVYIKHVVMTIGLNTWGLLFGTNTRLLWELWGFLICMGGGIMYQQSTSKKPIPANEVKAQESDEERQKLLELQSIAENGGDEKQVTGEGKS
ncbi:hypothetical protein DH2020_044284 [Rehmannia glutinosa]|uniref:Sugar phosphate transporter domain-containing protein n=1 Tax=Rehmannia glutinosa TaxID=99300 RepID=A0ABR0UHL2_REHGL